MIKVKSIGYLLLLLLVTNCYGQESYDFVVAKDGSGDFTTVQEAILSVPDFRDKETNNIYKERRL
ncbi:hypothetical protein NC796_19435 [Aliifodinibius sp. S!AR15-10]|nr:hypothetical protein [Aliifodinibius sp. S!AR15-10]MDR8393336.1 hypothetical protein [Aliifodinibius sp. S!AR15-10]